MTSPPPASDGPDTLRVAKQPSNLLLWGLIALWAVLMSRLMIADVWDETNGMLAFSDPAHSLGWKLQFVLTRSLSFYRPLPSAIAATVLHFVRSFGISWRILRAFNMVELMTAALLFAAALTRWCGTDRRRDLLFTLALLFSGSAVITAGWYANTFDASALVLIAAGTMLLSRDQALSAGVVFGLAFFCKETAVLALPFLVMLLAAGRIKFRQAILAGVPAATLGAIYFVIRSRVIAFGSRADTHGFDPHFFLPTLANLCESFWRQTLKGDGPHFWGYLFFALAVLSFRRVQLMVAALLFTVGTAVIYWQMLMPYQDGMLITHLNFIGRLYLVPAALMLFMLASERREAVIALLLVPILLGGVTTYRDHTTFQRTYRTIYETAAGTRTKPLRIDYGEKPLSDTVRGIEIGAFPDASMRIDPGTGQLLFR